MKTTMRGLMFVVLAVVGTMAVLVGNAQGKETSLPPEVKKLIGMKMTFDNNRGSRVPGWERVGSYSLIPGNEVLGVDELYRESESIFAVIFFNKNDHSKTILDARVLPQDSLSYFVRGGQVVPRKSSRVLYFRNICKRADTEIVVGLMRPEPEMQQDNCTHWSKQVKRAWSIDEQTGRISEISTEGVSCFWETEFACLSSQD